MRFTDLNFWTHNLLEDFDHRIPLLGEEVKEDDPEEELEDEDHDWFIPAYEVVDNYQNDDD